MTGGGPGSILTHKETVDGRDRLVGMRCCFEPLLCPRSELMGNGVVEHKASWHFVIVMLRCRSGSFLLPMCQQASAGAGHGTLGRRLLQLTLRRRLIQLAPLSSTVSCDSVSTSLQVIALGFIACLDSDGVTVGASQEIGHLVARLSLN